MAISIVERASTRSFCQNKYVVFLHLGMKKAIRYFVTVQDFKFNCKELAEIFPPHATPLF